MISAQNKALNELTADTDFTIEHYRLLLQLAIKNYKVVSYANIPWGERFVLWRHDMDYSMNRGLALARIEAELGVKATYFINPHSEFYNIAESGQHSVIQEIISLGHDLGLHFDAAFYEIQSEQDLSKRIQQDVTYIQQLFQKLPTAFSFHNPSAPHLTFESDYYGGSLNCYSKRFKSAVPYCSDSNGYWRFRRLFDVLSEATDPCLQVLTHPGWWQTKPMPPRQRIARAVYGRSVDTLRFYDKGLEKDGRKNLCGDSQVLDVIRLLLPQQFELFDYLWNQGRLKTLFVDLWCQFEVQMARLLKVLFFKDWRVPAGEINTLFDEHWQKMDRWTMLDFLFGASWDQHVGIHEDSYRKWETIRNQIIRGYVTPNHSGLVEGSKFICQLMQYLAKWGKNQSIKYDGLACLKSIGLPIEKAPGNSLCERLVENSSNDSFEFDQRWIQFNQQIPGSLRGT